MQCRHLDARDCGVRSLFLFSACFGGRAGGPLCSYIVTPVCQPSSPLFSQWIMYTFTSLYQSLGKAAPYEHANPESEMHDRARSCKDSFMAQAVDRPPLT